MMMKIAIIWGNFFFLGYKEYVWENGNVHTISHIKSIRTAATF